MEAAGYTSIETEDINLSADTTQDLKIKQGAQINLKAVDKNGNPVPFKVVISGLTAEMKTLGGAVYFSDSQAKDRYGLEFNMSQAENITFTATYGGGYTSNPVTYTTNVGEKGVNHTFVIDQLIDPKAEGWYAMDNHNHSDFGDGSTSIQDLYSIQIAEQLDFNVVTDHDSRVNNQDMADMAKNDKRVFISGTEVSPGWGHWNILNVGYGTSDKDKASVINPSEATPQEIIAVGRSFNNTIVNLNHPYSDYGFLRNQESVRGGTNAGWDGFDLLEIQSTLDLNGMTDITAADWKNIDLQHLNKTIPAKFANQDMRTLISAMAFWNQGVPKYLNAGSDAHDAHSTTLFSGYIRLYAQLDDYSLETYLDALRAGHDYITMGPILFPDANNMFGETVKAKAGEELTLKMDVQSVNGMDKVYLWRNGVCIGVKELNGTTDRTTVSFTTPAAAGEHVWYSFTVVDSKGKWAVTNPIWADVEGGFGDVMPEAWYYAAVTDLADKGLMNGNNGKFSPDAKLTRGMVATVLYRMSGETTGVAADAAKTFSDVAANQWYAAAVDWAADNGIVSGYQGKFSPNANITRQDMVTMLYRYAQYKKADTTKTADLATFGDAATVSGYAADAMKWAVGDGVMSGRSGNLLAPKAQMSRAEFAKMVSNYLA